MGEWRYRIASAHGDDNALIMCQSGGAIIGGLEDGMELLTGMSRGGNGDGGGGGVAVAKGEKVFGTADTELPPLHGDLVLIGV